MLGAMNETDESEPAAITPDELRELMADLGLTGAALSRLVSVDKGAPGRWLSGDVPVPLWLVEHLGVLLALRRICRALWGDLPDAEPEPLPARLAHLGNIAIGDKTTQLVPTEIISANIQPMPKASAQVHTMTPEDFRKALAALGWRQADFVRRVGCGTNTASRWARGTNPIPAWVSAHLTLLAEIEKLHLDFVQPQREKPARDKP